MAKIIELEDTYNMMDVEGRSLVIFKDGRWTFNGDEEVPTFTPSVKYKGPSLKEGKITEFVNHFKITDGRVEYLPSTTHSGKGRILDLKNAIPEMTVEPGD